MRKEWSYVKKKSQTPEKVSETQETLKKTSINNSTIKTPSLIPIVASFCGLAVSGRLVGFQSIAFVVFIGIAAVINGLYYGLKLILAFRLRRKQQDYDQSIPKKDAVAHEDAMKQKEWDHEKEMKQMDLEHQKELKKMDYEYELKKMNYEKEIKQMELNHKEKMMEQEGRNFIIFTEHDHHR